ncbi:hypothetical protein SDC9_08656 [bioreactor metagenome]|uniref:Uncharacterized protein n=1 Tax=bioreactor metagenome TaxID=1076179 RepID=A0A644T7W5_9ZZZZ
MFTRIEPGTVMIKVEPDIQEALNRYSNIDISRLARNKWALENHPVFIIIGRRKHQIAIIAQAHGVRLSVGF